MTIKELYREYKIPDSERDSKPPWHETGLSIRKKAHLLTESDFEELNRILIEDNQTDFTLYILEYLDTFPKILFDTLIEKLIESRCKEYIYPCIRVFGGSATNSRIQQIIKNSTGLRKWDALYVLYFCVDEKYKWNEETESYEEDYSSYVEVQNDTSKMNERGRYIIDFVSGKKYYIANESFLYERYNFLLDELLDEKNDLEIKYQINLLLPNKLTAFPDELIEKAKVAFNLIEKLKLRDDPEEL